MGGTPEADRSDAIGSAKDGGYYESWGIMEIKFNWKRYSISFCVWLKESMGWRDMAKAAYPRDE